MLQPLKQWICDVCHKVIQSPEEAILIWEVDDDEQYCNFCIVHHMKCDNNAKMSSSMHLEEYLGINGLSKLLAFLDPGPLIYARGVCDDKVSDIHKFVDLVRRLQIPHYEAARQIFQTEEVKQRFFDSNEIQPYLIETLEALARDASARESAP